MEEVAETNMFTLTSLPLFLIYLFSIAPLLSRLHRVNLGKVKSDGGRSDKEIISI